MAPTAEGDACGMCESCVSFDEQRSYNIHELDAASNNSVDDIRAIIEQVRIPPAVGKYKVFIIDEVHMLSSQAFNAFLKTLEEPPRHVIFILATTERHKVLPTILSRCQIYDFARISIADIADHLSYVAEMEGIKADPDALNVIAQKADGGMRDALSVFDQMASFTDGDITYQAVIDNLNVLDYEYYFHLTADMLDGSVRHALLTLNDILGRGFDGHNVITGLSSHFRDLFVCKDESTLVLYEVGASIRERYKDMAKRCPDAFLFKAIEITNTCDLNYRASRNKRLLLDLTIIQLCQIIPSASPAPPSPTLSPIPASPPSQTVSQAPASEPIKASATPTVVSTSIRKVVKDDIGDVVKADVVVEEELLTPVDEAALVECWDGYAVKIDGNAYLKGVMSNCKPVLGDKYCFEVSVHNRLQHDELTGDEANLLAYMRRELKNTRLAMRVVISETKEKKLAYTPLEKYEHLLKINPLLARLKEEFDLVLD
jgi:DNA polymerase-3 subunit gamma/tau